MQSVEDEIIEGDEQTIEGLVDIDSLVDTYILEEYSKNIDVGWSSFFMYKKAGGKLYFGPPWDFDLAFGNDYRLDDGAWEGIYVGADMGFKSANVCMCGSVKYDGFASL